MKINKLITVCCLISFGLTGLFAQTAFFIDGYHGGIYGHYPLGQTGFMADMLKKHPNWSISIEVEPETWDVVKQRDPDGFNSFKELFKDQSITGRIEYVNPTYAQSFFYTTSGESVIRQFSYGIDLVRKHFPEAIFTSYSAEEPCFTSCLPPILKSFGYSYASTKNPNTMWGGYTRAYGGELVNWIGPDGTQLLTVPRYASEDLNPNSTWQSMAWNNSKEYINNCLLAGIKNPVGMCIQDASWSRGWDKGPWLGSDTSRFYYPTEYKTWRNYIKNYSIGSTTDDWHFTQEDVLPGLMWGAEVLQRLAQEVREAENKLIATEKLASLASLYRQIRWPVESIDEGWTKVLLSQHHDCWIVPYNRLQGEPRTWAEQVTVWTNLANTNCNNVIEQSMRMLTPVGDTGITVYNTLAFQRDEQVAVKIPTTWKNQMISIVTQDGMQIPSQMIINKGNLYLTFIALAVPPMGFTSYRIVQNATETKESPSVTQQEDGSYLLENDLYAITIDSSKGGVIKSLKSKNLNGKEFVDVTNERSFNELRGYFFNEETFLSSTQSPAKIEVLEQGQIATKIAIHGKIGKHPFTQTIRLVQGEKRIDMTLKIDWEDVPGIGESNQTFRREESRKPFYDSRYKLLVHFPANMTSQQVYKNAPFDVCESRLENTFFNSWDQLKHNVILNWVDLYDKTTEHGMALFTDHTTSYAHGNDHPLALTVQYAGRGLWLRDYTITRPTEISYAILLHANTWTDSRIWSEGERINEPLLATLTNSDQNQSKSLLNIQDNAYELSSIVCKGNDLYVRFFNAQNDASNKSITFNLKADRVELVELNDEAKEIQRISQTDEDVKIDLTIPQFGIRTIRLVNAIETQAGE